MLNSLLLSCSSSVISHHDTSKWIAFPLPCFKIFPESSAATVEIRGTISFQWQRSSSFGGEKKEDFKVEYET